MRFDENWKPIGTVSAAVVTRLRDEQMRREFIKRKDAGAFASLCASHGVDPRSIPDAPFREAAE